MTAAVTSEKIETYRDRLAREHRERRARFFPAPLPTRKIELPTVEAAAIAPAPAAPEPSASVVVITKPVLEAAKHIAVAGPPTVAIIIRECSAVFGVTALEIKSARRLAKIVRARQTAMYVAKKLTSRSFPELGRRMGGRDHTTVLHAVRRIEDLCLLDADLAAKVAAVEERVRAACVEACAAAQIVAAADGQASIEILGSA